MTELELYNVDKIYPWEYFTSVIYIFLVYFTLYFFFSKSKDFKYLIRGFVFKIVGGIFFALTYLFYYKGGDTFAYFYSSECLVNLLYSRPDQFFELIFNPSQDTYSFFNLDTGYAPSYIFFDNHTFSTVILTLPFVILGCKSYLLTTMIISTFTFIGSWKLFKFFEFYFPQLKKYIAISVLYLPSLIFWGSGILKDGIVFTFLALFIYYFNLVFIQKKLSLWSIFILLFSLISIINIKPYVFFTLIFGLTIWWIFSEVGKIKNFVIKFISVIVLLALSIVGSSVMYFLLEDKFGKYSVDAIVETAAITQDDLKRDYYQGNSFDIGTFDPSIAGILSKFPQATTAGLIRPFIWEVRSVSMLFSALENLIILIMIIYSLWLVRLNFFKIFQIIFEHPVLLFSMIYSFMFAFSIGLSTSNFGALVRFKIPFLPFFVTALIVILYRLESGKKLT